jgi:hypothetical protein
VKQTGHARYYDRLTPEERFRLDVLAMAWGDMDESELLTRTCPQHNYIMNDVGFAGRWQAAKELTTLTYMDLSSRVERLRLVEAFGLIIGAFAELAKLEADAYAERTTDEEHRGAHSRALRLAHDMPEQTEDLQRSIAEGGLTVWAAFKGFCEEEMGLEAEALLGALAEPMVQTARELEEIAEGLEVEPELEAVEDCTEALRENWQRQLARG